MARRAAGRWYEVRRLMSACVVHPVCVGCLPALLLMVYWAVGESALIAAALLFPTACLLVSASRARVASDSISRSAVIGLMQRDGFTAIAETVFDDAAARGLKSALFKVEIDNHEEMLDIYGQSAADKIIQTIGDRLVAVLRDKDAVARTGDWAFTACLAPVRQLDLELCIQLAGRLQEAVEKPVSIDRTTVYVTACVGFCEQARVAGKSFRDWVDAVGAALREAQHNGPNSIRAYSEEMRRKSESRAELREDVAAALENGEIEAWFQPQISTDTGLVTGFEALARWNHSRHGMIQPAAFLSAIEQAGLLERLAEVMMLQAFTALTAWDKAGVVVPQVGVNFAGPELNNPRLVDKVKWELDRFGLAPNRLAVEVLETVVASAPHDTVTRNINGLCNLGCRIDLDDFGTGHTAISSIRRFSVSRIKIDRSFVIKSDRDPEQQRMITAILTMAERLGVETLAEGVETVGEHALLAQLGCDHVQGYGIGKPMPFEQTLEWMAAHNAKLTSAAQIVGNKLR